ncbi:unnamed protein product [Effrenium voratum]|nr:unnamed protein product [Effrenium voratum]
MASVPDEWVHADNEIQQRVESGWISKDEGHRLRTLLKMGETPERRPNKESEFWTHTSNEMLKDLLLKKELPTPWSKFLAAIGVAWVKRSKMRESDAYRSGAEYRNSFPLLDYIVHSDRFEAFTGVIWILLPLGIDNAVLRPFAVLRLFRVVKLGKLMRASGLEHIRTRLLYESGDAF